MQASRLTLAYEDDMDVAELPNIPNYTALHNSFAPDANGEKTKPGQRVVAEKHQCSLEFRINNVKAVGGHVPASDTDTDGLCIRDEHDTRPPHAKPYKPLKDITCRAPQS